MENNSQNQDAPQNQDELSNLFFEQIWPLKNDLFGYILAKLKNYHDAEDVFQHVLLKGCSKMYQKQPQGRFSSWIYRIAHNPIVDFFEKRENEPVNGKQFSIALHDCADKSDEIENENQVKEEKIQMAQSILNSLPDELREVFYLRRVAKLKLQDIAEVIGKSEATVRDRLKRANALVSQQSQKVVISGIAAAISSEYVGALTQQAHAKALELYPEAAFVSAATATSTTTGAGATAIKAVTHTVSGFCAAVALPFLWIMSLLIGSRMCGTAFVYYAPTLRVRRWIIEQILYCYCGFVLLPMLHLTVSTLVSHFFEHNQYSNIFLSTINWIVFVSVFIYFGWARDKYLQIMRTPQQFEHGAGQTFQRLRKKTLICFYGTTTLLLVFLGWLFATTVNPLAAHEIGEEHLGHANAAFAMFGIFSIIVLIFHAGTFLRFREFLSMSENDEAFNRTGPDLESIPRVRDVSTILLFLFAIATLAPSLLHVFLVQTYTGYACVEFAIFALLWGRIYLRNIESEKYHSTRVVVTFLIQIAVMQIVREWFVT